MMDYASMPAGPASADAGQCALKLWRLQALFRRLAGEWGMKTACRGDWPRLVLYRDGLFLSRRLELRLQPEFLLDGRELYEFRFVEAWQGFLGGRSRHDFACGRLFADEVLCEPRVARELMEKARLLGLTSRPSGLAWPAGRRCNPRARRKG